MKNKVLICVMVLMLMMSANSCSGSSSSPEKLADMLHELPTESEDHFNYDLDFQRAAGLLDKDTKDYPHGVDSLNDFQITEDFYNTYIEKYGMYDLLEHFNNYLICVEDAENYNPNDVTAEYVQEVNNRDKEVHENLYNLAAYKELDTLVFDGKEIQNSDNPDGYYSGMKDTSDRREVKGEFNDAAKDNEVYEESASQSEETTYAGDWMVRHEHGSRYDEGKYGWNNGVFEDEAAHWDSFSTFDIYYRGEEWVSISAPALEEIYLEFKKTEEQPDKRFYFAYDNVRNAESVSWVNEPSGSQFASCSSYIKGLEAYLNEMIPDKNFKIKKGELFKGEETTSFKISMSVASEAVDFEDQTMDLPPDGVSIDLKYFYPNSADEETYNIYYAFLAYSDGSTEGLSGGKRIFDQLYSLIDYDKSFGQYERMDLDSGNKATISTFVYNPLDKSLGVGIKYD